jgi:hypothetical protein
LADLKTIYPAHGATHQSADIGAYSAAVHPTIKPPVFKTIVPANESANSTTLEAAHSTTDKTAH